jgi:RecA-family ATPase
VNHIPRPDLEAILAEYATLLRTDATHRARSIAARILPRSELASLPDPTPLIADTLDRHSVILLAGPWGSGKSFIALDWAARLATGLPWQARAVHATEPILYVAAEGAWGMRRRLDAWEYGWGAKLTDDRFFVLTRPVNLLAPAEVAELCEQMRTRGIRHVVVDTLARCLIGADENSARDMGLAVDALYEIREATGDGGTVIAVHHTGKDKTTVRGSSALEAGVDTVYQTTGDARLIHLQRTKRKDGPVEDTLRLTLNPVLDSVVVSAASAAGLSNSQDLIVRVLVSHFSDVGPVSATTLRDVCDLPKATFYEALNVLASRGVVAIEGTARSRTVALTGTRPRIT